MAWSTTQQLRQWSTRPFVCHLCTLHCTALHSTVLRRAALHFSCPFASQLLLALFAAAVTAATASLLRSLVTAMLHVRPAHNLKSKCPHVGVNRAGTIFTHEIHTRWRG